MKPVIGLIPLYDDEKDSFWMLPGYMRVIEKCGGIPIMLPLTTDKDELEQVYNLCDGILFTGGHDVSPKVYGEEKKETCGVSCHMRDAMEGYILSDCLEDNKPFLGICRGIQFVNAYLGGTLYQDLPTEYQCTVEHHMEPPYDKAAHQVEILKGTKLAEILGAGMHAVNSYHHQAIKEMAPDVEKMAVSEDGLIEAIAVKNHRFGIAVQWHPEFSYETNQDSIKLVNAFINECK